MSKASLILLFLIWSNYSAAFAQSVSVNDLAKQFSFWQDSLKKLSRGIVHANIEPERYNANYAFIKTLVSALKTRGSFNFTFDSLKTVSIVSSSDSRFKLFTWHVLNDDGTYRYYGAVQMNTSDGNLKLFPLVDRTSLLKNPADTLITNDKWYGARYYKIIPVNQGPIPFYILLGWKGNSTKSTKKVIDVLFFKDEKAFLGMSIFDKDPRYTNNKRIIFEYTSKSSMFLSYLADQKMIVFDHLAPMNESVIGNQEFYGPDMSYDGFKILKGRCIFTSDLPLKNPPSDKDDQFIAPNKVIKTNK